MQLMYCKMAFLDFPLTLGACTIDCTCTIDILEDVVFLNFIKPKKYSDPIHEEHNLSSIIVQHHQCLGSLMGSRGCGGASRGLCASTGMSMSRLPHLHDLPSNPQVVYPLRTHTCRWINPYPSIQGTGFSRYGYGCVWKYPRRTLKARHRTGDTNIDLTLARHLAWPGSASTGSTKIGQA